MRIVEERDWHDHVLKIGQDKQDQVSRNVLTDMHVLVPIDTGALDESLTWGRTDDTTTRVGSTDKDYSVYVEEGHEIVYVNTSGVKVRTGRFQPPQPYMKPALFRERSL
ncbi:MAG TPA: hypothetical protein VHX38_02610 [Pseudonocardiaceae bacterium]|jgi:hypothetical protein|nr:hypothetical protein [Pseudonocardiaceae bacterium]